MLLWEGPRIHPNMWSARACSNYQTGSSEPFTEGPEEEGWLVKYWPDHKYSEMAYSPSFDTLTLFLKSYHTFPYICFDDCVLFVQDLGHCYSFIALIIRPSLPTCLSAMTLLHYNNESYCPLIFNCRGSLIVALREHYILDKENLPRPKEGGNSKDYIYT